MTATLQSREEWWSPSDLFFLQDALNRGMTCADVAGFLSREEDEVRKKASADICRTMAAHGSSPFMTRSVVGRLQSSNFVFL
jgi:hypothetical protein